MKKVLIITYYWPPKGGVGVQRWLKFSKYLSNTHYAPVIYTPQGGECNIRDISLNDVVPPNIEVIHKNIYEPQSILNFFASKKPSADILISQHNSFFYKILIWIRANLFIPDTRSLWISPSVKFLDNYLKNNNIDCIISTGPPHSMHMIALQLVKKHNIKWIADFRDPWTGVEYFDKLPLLLSSKRKHFALEREVLQRADVVLSVSQSWANDFIKLGAKKTHVITNGYDMSDYKKLPTMQHADVFKIGHFGLYNELRDHNFLWDVLYSISNDTEGFLSRLKLLFAGEVYSNFFDKIEEKNLLNHIEYYSQLPHSTAIQKMMECDVLLVTQSDTNDALGRLPAKFFEYLATRIPIIAIGRKNSDLEAIMHNISYCWFVDFNNTTLLYDTILHIYKIRNLNSTYNDDIDVFSRQNQVRELVKLMDSIC